MTQLTPRKVCAPPEWKLFSVTVPTRNRPAKLRRCLESLAAAREHADYTVFVCDSSTDRRLRAEVVAACEAFPFAELHHHQGKTRAAARNVCARVARSELVITVDDDVYVEPDTIKLLVEAYHEGSGPRVIAGSMQIAGGWTEPQVMRHIGYGRSALPGESPSFVLTGLLLYPRALALEWPWNERVPTQEDRFMSALWRRHGIQLLHELSARAVHDGVPREKLEEQESHIYVNLFDSLVASRAPLRATAYELLGFAAGAKLYCRTPVGTLRFLRAWAKGHRAFLRDQRELRALCKARSVLELLATRTELLGSIAVSNPTLAPSPSLDTAESRVRHRTWIRDRDLCLPRPSEGLETAEGNDRARDNREPQNSEGRIAARGSARDGEGNRGRRGTAERAGEDAVR